MTDILLVRHGQACFAGPDYDHLSGVGETQSRLLGAWLALDGRGPGRVVTGTLRRHRQTAAAMLAAMPAPARPATPVDEDPGLDEFDFIEVVRRHRPDLGDLAAINRFIAASPAPARDVHLMFAAALTRWMAAPDDGSYRESWDAFRRRCRAAFDRAAGESGGRVTLVTSGGPIAAICQSLLGLDDVRAADLNFVLFNAAVTRIRATADRTSLLSFNTIGHLERTGDRAMITRR